MALLTLDRLSKSYGPTRALVNFSLSVRGGDVVALVGENGAGKSTLARLLAGAESPDAGSVSLDGIPVNLSSPREAMRHGIGFIPQELAPVSTLSLAENLFLGGWPSRSGVVSQRGLQQAARAELSSLGFGDIDLAQRAAAATLPELQLVEIAKAVRRRSTVIVFDEPTASLNEAETKALHRIIVSLSQRDVAIIYISHRMDEVFAFSHRICVLRNGRKAAEHDTHSVRRHTIVEEMVGRAVSVGQSESESSVSHNAGELLRLDGCTRQDRPTLADASLVLHGHEIVGLYGLRGAGADTITAVLGGYIRATAGQLWVRGEQVPLPRSPREARRQGVGYIPQDRKTQGLALRLSVADNISLSNLRLVSRAGIVSPSRQRRLVSPLVDLLRIRLRATNQRVEELSGGNQQKVLLAGRLAQRGAVLVLEEPTRGVDVGSRAEIHDALRRLATEGVGILLFSSDVEEIVSVCHRVLVVRGGKIVTELTGRERTQANAVAAATATEWESEALVSGGNR